MKKIISIAALLFLFLSVFPQSPCGWFSNPTPDSITLDANRLSFDVHKLRADQQVEFDGLIDDLWAEFGFDTLKNVPIVDPGQTINALASWCYDIDWLYLIVIIAGDDTVDIIGTAGSSDLVQLTYQKVFGGAGTDSSHYNQADWRKWLWKKDGDRKWIMPGDKDNNLFVWLDQDLNNNGTGACSETEGDLWLSAEVTKQVKYFVNVTTDSLIFEMAFGWKNFLYMDSMPSLSYEFGFDISYKDYENDSKTGQINLNDPGNNAWAYAPALAKFVIADTLPPPLGTNYIEQRQYQLKTFPNPASEQVQIILPPGDNYMLFVIDLTGRKVEQTLIPANTSKYVLNVHEYPSGIYNVLLSNEEKIYHSKIIIQ